MNKCYLYIVLVPNSMDPGNHKAWISIRPWKIGKASVAMEPWQEQRKCLDRNGIKIYNPNINCICNKLLLIKNQQ